MKVIHGNGTAFLKSLPVLSIRVFVREKKEHYALIQKENGSSDFFASCEYELGNSAVSVLYDSTFERIIAFLSVSEEIVARIKRDNNLEAEWSYFEKFATELFNNGNMHPFYYPLFLEVANAYRFGMCDAQGHPLADDHFVLIGKSLVQMKQTISMLLDAQDKTKDTDEAVICYRDNAFSTPILIENLQAEMMSIVSEGKERFEFVMVLTPRKAEEIWNYLLAEYVSSGIRFKRCENCRRFFATTGRGNPKFCERLIEGKGKSCRQLMPKLNFYSKAEKDPAIWLYNRAYKTMYSRVTAGTMQKEMFKEWARRARTRRDACSNGDISAEEYSAWLCSNGLFIDYLKGNS